MGRSLLALLSVTLCVSCARDRYPLRFQGSEADRRLVFAAAERCGVRKLLPVSLADEPEVFAVLSRAPRRSKEAAAQRCLVQWQQKEQVGVVSVSIRSQD